MLSFLRKKSAGKGPHAELARFVGTQLAHAAWSVSEGETLIPFRVAFTPGPAGGTVELIRFVTERIEEGTEAARAWFAGNRNAFKRAMYVFDGYATIDGVRRDALIAEAAADGDGASFMVVLPYRPATDAAGFKVDRPVLSFREGLPPAPDQLDFVLAELRAGRDLHPSAEARRVANWG